MARLKVFLSLVLRLVMVCHNFVSVWYVVSCTDHNIYWAILGLDLGLVTETCAACLGHSSQSTW